MIRFILIVICLFVLKTFAFSETNIVDSMLLQRGEVNFSFTIPNNYSIRYLSEIISIDKVEKSKIWAYANKMEMENFKSLKIPFQIEPFNRPNLSENRLKSSNLNYYPTYEEYVNILQSFAVDYPTICTLSEFGKSTNNRKLLCLSLSNKNNTIHKPKVLLNGGIHGDELLGYVMLLRFANYLLDNNQNIEIANLLNSIEIEICPLINPDGAYFGGNKSVQLATRYNANHIDLNRNFSSLEGEPDKNPLQAETMAMMDFMKKSNFVLSATFHGGAELVNYPWDEWQNTHPDNSWLYTISRSYADTVHAHSTAGYFTDESDGISNGYAWYQVTGGRQDWATYFGQSRELTIEISNTKMPLENQLEQMSLYHQRALINLLKYSQTGIFVKVLDIKTNLPVTTTMEIQNYDTKFSTKTTDSLGYIFRLLNAGNYSVTFSALGYVSKNVLLKTPSNEISTIYLQKDSLNSSISELNNITPNPFSNKLYFNAFDKKNSINKVTIFNISGKIVFQYQSLGNEIDVSFLKNGMYIVKLDMDGKVIVKKMLKIDSN